MLAAPTASSSTEPAILIVEDDANVRQLLHRMLAYLGNRTTAAVDTASAVAATLDQSELALALIDLNLKGSNGLAAARALQALRPDLLIVLMSGDPHHLLMAQQLMGTLHVLHKPFSLEDLAELITAARCHLPQLKEQPLERHRDQNSRSRG